MEGGAPQRTTCLRLLFATLTVSTTVIVNFQLEMQGVHSVHVVLASVFHLTSPESAAIPRGTVPDLRSLLQASPLAPNTLYAMILSFARLTLPIRWPHAAKGRQLHTTDPENL